MLFFLHEFDKLFNGNPFFQKVITLTQQINSIMTFNLHILIYVYINYNKKNSVALMHIIQVH